MALNVQSAKEEYYRVFAFGPGHGALISERFSKDAADKRQREWQQSMPHADVRIEKVNANGWPICDMVLLVPCPRCGPIALGVRTWSYLDGEKIVSEYRANCKCGQELYGFVPRN
jgi:hypothetical protein